MNATHEEWRPVVGYEGEYEVSDHGRIRSLDRIVNVAPSVRSAGYQRRQRGRIISPSRGPSGHLRIILHGNDRPDRGASVHVLVLTAFVGPRPEGMFCCHEDDNPANNHVSNLRWDTPTANQLDALRNGRNKNANKTHCKHGHEYTPENTYRQGKRGGRFCRECHLSRRRNGVGVGGHNARKTHCPQGHEYSPENTGTSKNGHVRWCRTCKRQKGRETYYRDHEKSKERVRQSLKRLRARRAAC